MHCCPICEVDPSSHSFKIIGKVGDKYVLYTCPAEATKYKDRQGIKLHYKNTLDKINNEKWIWIFDSKNLTKEHVIEIKVAISIAKIISKNKNLTKIVIKNPTWHINAIIPIVKPFLPKDLEIEINETSTS